MVATPMRFHRSRLGATLAEGILAIFISSMFLSVLPGFYLTSIRIWQRESSKLEAACGADFALQRMEEDVRNARSATVSISGNVVTLTLPLRVYDATLKRPVNVLGPSGYLQDGDRIQYYFLEPTSDATGFDGVLYRRLVHPDGTADPARVVAAHIQPALNPLDPATGFVPHLFAFDPDSRSLTITVAAAEPKPSAGTFGPNERALSCRRDGGRLLRVPSETHPEGEIRCSICGPELKTTAEVAAFQTRLMLRNE